MTVEVWIPLPPADVSPNRSSPGAWQAEAKAKKEYRRTAAAKGLIAKRDGGAIVGPVRIDVAFYMGLTKTEALLKEHFKDFPKMRPKPTYYRPLDSANGQAALKAAVDGLVDSGLIEGDSHDRLEWGEIKLLRKQKEHQGQSGVLIRISSAAVSKGEA